MPERLFKIDELVSVEGETSMEVIFQSKIHEIHLWRIAPEEWIYPHIHPYNDDICMLFKGQGSITCPPKKQRKSSQEI
jgi:hypothetical protein